MAGRLAVEHQGKALLYDIGADAFRYGETGCTTSAPTPTGEHRGNTLRAPEGEMDDEADAYVLAVAVSPTSRPSSATARPVRSGSTRVRSLRLWRTSEAIEHGNPQFHPDLPLRRTHARDQRLVGAQPGGLGELCRAPIPLLQLTTSTTSTPSSRVGEVPDAASHDRGLYRIRAAV